jgi:hypothetical protein
MKNPKSIMLEVISASYRLPAQKAFNQIKKYHPLSKRTMCVVTKPDNAVPWSNSPSQFVSYAQSKLQGYHLELGWHMVKNLERNSRNQSLDDGDKAEREFFTQAA